MKLHEYQSKRLFSEYGIPIPGGDVASTAAEAVDIASRIGGNVVVKAQVLVGGRGKAGGVKIAEDHIAAGSYADEILGMEISGLTVRKVLIDQAVGIDTEIYLGITNDRLEKRPVIMASASGGIDIEEVAADTPEMIVREHIHPFLGLKSYQMRNMAVSIKLPEHLWKQFNSICQSLYSVYKASDATLAEINPLVVTSEGDLLAVDGKMVLDENALGRQGDLEQLRDSDLETVEENEARRYGLSYVALDGDIGCMVNGAGLAMGTMDIIKYFGGEPANFLDIGGGATAEKVSAALRIILKDGGVKVLLINIFGGITRCDEVAKGVVHAIEEVGVDIPMVVRLVGTNEEEGRELLASAKLATASSLADAAQKAIALAA
ncbi:MAG: ADP-forming succinate--CoA ligase subunit beta [Chloroflexi bacterium]|nr:ADP-forming succinate--CoA ligase subunit beta [Chloroflexota bacterium]MBS59738.1 ADP-forming succinate--CoA ligase subunit beta [Anaerolineaceae bacterium]